MQEDVRNDLKSQLALMIARGQTINTWASQNEVPLRTAYRWSREPQVRGEVQEWRRFVLNLTLGRLARLSLKATDGIAKLGAGAESESGQVRAWRSDMAHSRQNRYSFPSSKDCGKKPERTHCDAWFDSTDLVW